MYNQSKQRRMLLTAMFLLLPASVPAGEDAGDVAIDLINPISGRAALHTRYDYRTFQGRLPGASERAENLWSMTPSYGFTLANGKKLVVRATVPLGFSTPTYVTEDDEQADWLIRKRADTLPDDERFISGHGHLDDIRYDVAYGGVSDTGVFSMIGLAGVLPTSRDASIARDQFLLGPEFALGRITDWGIYGFWFRQLIDVYDRRSKVDWDTNDSLLELIFAYDLGNGWNIVSNPVIEYDWEGAGGNKLSVPLGGGISNTRFWGRVPVKLDLEAYYYVESPEAFGAKWMLTFRMTPALWDR
jgi:hypothetical protein